MITTGTMLNFFPMSYPREKQAKAIDFICSAIDKGYKHMVIAAPTGTGKTAIGATVCLWAASPDAVELSGAPGGYYLVTQKMLQDQLERDFVSHPELGCASLKSAASYECDNPKFKNCDLGRKKKCGCTNYETAKYDFTHSTIGVTNYSYFLTERINVGKLENRKVIILDECHNVERLLVRFYDITVGPEQMDDVEILEDVPNFSDINEFVNWCSAVYEPLLKEKSATFNKLVAAEDKMEYADKANRLSNQLDKLTRALNSIQAQPKGWVFWSQDHDKQRGAKVYTARPLYAHEFTTKLFDSASIVVHMSAFPGDKETYCLSLGLNPDDVAWASFASTFPPENRPINVLSVGSMSLRNIDTTLPRVISCTHKILDKWRAKKGLIHCNSYKVGQAIFDAMSETDHAPRLIFPRTADEREQAFKTHSESEVPTVMISPSMTEGYDFAGLLAEWQIIAKIPYPNLGDKHTWARKSADDNWYKMETIKTIVQASGRIVRSESDRGVTYILDSDINRLLDEQADMFPRWWMAAVKR